MNKIPTNNLLRLFEECLDAKYLSCAEGSNYAIKVIDKTVYIFFEKSNGIEDWKNNFSFPHKPYKRMDVSWNCHGGFLKVWKAMKDEIENRIAELISYTEIDEIQCVGYSHGAALAVLCTEDMEYLYGEKYKISGVGFGTPRVLWGYIPTEIRYRLRNFVAVRNIPDIVTHVPPVLFGFRNVGTLLRIGEPDKYSPVDAHRPSSYICELNNLK